jgi:hypothetical protein
MIRPLPTVFLCAIVANLAWAQPQATQPSAAQNNQTVGSAPAGVKPPNIGEQVASDTAVVTVHGICPSGQAQTAAKPDACTVVFTREQFEAMVSSINVTNQKYTPPALRVFATDYATLMALAEAGEKEGVDKDPRFQELMRMARTRSLAESYRRFLQEKYANPSTEEIEQYYKQNVGKFEQVYIQRIQVPRVNPKRPQEKRPEFETKAREVAADLRERAAKGEDITSLQVEAYNSLGLAIQPPQTDLPVNPRPTFLPNVEQDIKNLKPGEVTKVEFEPSGLNIYKLRNRSTISLDVARPEIVRQISQSKVDAALKAATGGVHSDLNEQYFNPRPTGAPQPARLPARMLPPGAVQSNRPAPTGAVPAGGATPAATPASPAAQKTATPK